MAACMYVCELNMAALGYVNVRGNKLHTHSNAVVIGLPLALRSLPFISKHMSCPHTIPGWKCWVKTQLHVAEVKEDMAIFLSKHLQLPLEQCLGRQRHPYIVFRFRYLYGCMLVYFCNCKWRRSRHSLRSLIH